MKSKFSYILTAFILLLAPCFIFSQTAPNLNTASTFVLFTGNGEFTSNSPSTIVVGDVGNEVGAVSAFPPGLLLGNKHFGDATATQVGTDISAAYADLLGRACGFVHPVGFGGDEVLTPGIYCAGAASTWGGNITLDAGGDASAIFIIKVNGAFSSVTGSQVVLINNATACNVFWQIGGQLDLVNTVMRGTVLVDGAINLTDGTIVDGRIFTKTGALIFGRVTVNICDATAVPLQLVNFEVMKIAGNNVQITWTTAAELNVLRYEVEASINNSVFYRIGSMSAKGNRSATMYNLQDMQLNKTGLRFYRLKMLDKDGAVTYSPVKSLKFSDLKTGLINIFPNPAGNMITVTANSETDANVTLTITNMQGQKLTEKAYVLNKGINNLAENIHALSKGTYMVRMKNNSNGTETWQKLEKL